MVFELSLHLAVILLLVSIIAGFIDAIAGGSGLIAVPVLLWVGVAPTAALATSQLQSSGGSLFASVYFIRQGVVKLGEIKWAIGSAFIGAALGTMSVELIDASVLEYLLPFLILSVGGYFLFSKKLNEKESHQVISAGMFALTASLGLGFYDGFFGPGTGSFFVLACVSLLGFGLTKATAHAKVLNFATNIAALLFFAIDGKVMWLIGCIMLLGQAVGATIGSRLVITQGIKVIKPLVVTMSVLMSIKLFTKQFL